MKLAITVWNGRIAPLFDVARHILIAQGEGYGEKMITVATVELENSTPDETVDALESLGIDAVVCGAISREYEQVLLEAGIELDAFVAGDVEDVLRAWSERKLRQRGFSMPGCPCPRHRCRRYGMGRGPHSLRRRS